MFGRKKQDSTKEKEVKVETDEKSIHESPQICLFDLDESVLEGFKDASYNCSEGTLGKMVRVPNDRRDQQHFLKLNYSLPVNLHEHDILVFNMDFYEEVDYESIQISLDNVTGHSAHALLSAFPEKIFNPRAYATRILSKEVNEILKKESIVIVFASSQETVRYQQVEINSYENRITNQTDINNTQFYNAFPYCYNKTGKKMKSPDKDTKLTSLLLKYSVGSNYELAFHHPTHWDNSNKQIKDNNFIPLLLNNDGEIISFYHAHSKGAVLVFPCIKDKRSFLLELFNNYLSEIFPNLFPYHGQFGWLDNGEYLLPGEAELIDERADIEKWYIAEVEANEKSIETVKENYSFLRDLISESGDKLVSAVEHYLKWLGFPNVLNLDETTPDLLEEDIQVDCEDRFLVVEIKGVGGTSTDKDCSQISKIRYRRAEQRNKFDVYGLYIVNHQRYMPPKTRNNPPFTENQINDAVLDKRGLLTTYDLYNAYFLIESGVILKDEVRDCLFEYGLVELKPKSLVSIGIPQEYFSSGTVAIIDLNGIRLTKGASLYVKKNDQYSKVEIISLRVNDQDFDEVETGEVGVKLSSSVKSKSEFFVKQV
ncbi:MULTISPECIES: hypothetical protein [unclassified Pseudoalteromonas]|jgi:hypothetical protein|uniref:hypothetical protein n=1 Tax=unclassified Pseudoalteromonas TaxID=194690 RepID=UPI002359F628|nr:MULTISPECIES: hypothetical protein [unclassified Pseudoalteromonas]MDC9502919.1 hypothetical protein [Pseudoalteromonas sp. Angola-18]MDC9530350.1 hypothetical protein [Pseudoalteromonas sp. Angola-7]